MSSAPIDLTLASSQQDAADLLTSRSGDRRLRGQAMRRDLGLRLGDQS